MIRGASHIIFYGLPEYSHFYSEIVNLLQEASALAYSATKDGKLLADQTTTTHALFTKYEKMALERIVGLERCEQMLNSTRHTFIFT
jgi:U3 small nucleolar RNA-associated protein 25